MLSYVFLYNFHILMIFFHLQLHQYWFVLICLPPYFVCSTKQLKVKQSKYHLVIECDSTSIGVVVFNIRFTQRIKVVFFQFTFLHDFRFLCVSVRTWVCMRFFPNPFVHSSDGGQLPCMVDFFLNIWSMMFSVAIDIWFFLH